MANQIVVTQSGNVQVSIEPTPNVQVQISRAAITTLTDVPTANFANFAGNVTGANQPNITNIGTLANLSVTNTATIGNLVVTGNLSVGNLVANNANYANFAGTVVNNNQPNITSVGALTGLSIAGNIIPTSNIAYDLGNNTNRFNDIYLAGNTIYLGAQEITSNATGISFTGNLSGNATGLSNITGANVTGQVSFAATANSVAGANVSGTVANATYAANAGNATIANSANSVAVANVSGIGNIATVNLDGNSSNVLFGNGVFAPESTSIANANYANFAGTAFNVSGSNVSGEVANAAYANAANTANLATFATTANSVAGANVSGTVANATYAANAGNATIANSANSVAVANVSGIGNIATVNLDGSSSNVLFGNGVFAPESTSIANANYANFAGTAFNVSGSNVSGEVANAAYANIAGVANSVAGANVSGTVANANYSAFANVAASANSVAVANVSGIGNIATVNLDGSSSNVLFGNGVFAPESTSIANANYANFAGTAFNVSGSNVSGEVANANYSSFANVANIANSVAVANVSGIGNIATINLDGSSSNVLYGNGVFAPESTSIANANYANFAGTVITNAQPNITSVGNLPYLQVSNSANSTGVIRQTSSGNITFTTSAANSATYQITTQYHPNNNVGYPSDRYIRSRGNVTNPATASSGDRILARSGHVFNGNTNPLSIAETFTTVGAINANANALWTGGQWNMTTGNPQGNSANQESLTWQNQLVFTNSGSFQINPGTPANTSVGQVTSPILVTNYGLSTTDLASAGGFNQQKARGNRDGLLSVQAGDTVGRIAMWGYNGANYQSARPAALIARVDSSYVANATVIPLDMVIRTVNSSNVNVDTTFFGNGLTQFPGNISAVGGNVAITKTTGNATSLNLVGDKTTNSTFDIFDAQFSSSLSNVDTTGGFSPFRFQQFAPTNNNFGSMFMYRSRGNSFFNQAPVVAGDFIYSVVFQVNSNNTTVTPGTFTSVVNYNDNAGNVGLNIQLNATGTGTDGYNTGVIDLIANRTTANNFSANNVTVTNSSNLIYARTFGSFTSNVTQTSAGANTTNYMTFNNDEGSNGVSIVSNSQITVARTGRYNVQFSAQISHDTNATSNIEIWLTKNGSAIANTCGRLTLQKDQPTVAAWNFLDNVTSANSYYQIAWASPDINMEILAVDTANTISGVAIPSVIVTVVPVGA